MKRLGVPHGLTFELDLPAEGHPQAEGPLTLRLAGHPIWPDPATTSEPAVRWPWIDLLEHLTDCWPYLEWEESYPAELTPRWPDQLRSAAVLQRRPSGQPLDDDEDEAVYAFELRHDLAPGLRGAYLPSVRFMRERSDFRISAGPAGRPALTRRLLAPAADVLETLAGLGDALADCIECAGGSTEVVEAWRLRAPDPASRRAIAAGPAASRVALDRVPPAREASFLAAARMSSHVPVSQQQRLLDVLAQARLGGSPQLQATTSHAQQAFELVRRTARRTYEEGYLLADWFRDHLGLTSQAPFDPQAWLVAQGVPIHPIDLATDAIDAVAFWSEDPACAIIVNRNGRFASTPEGLRATLAHELAHLLVDRRAGHAAAEVLGGAGPEIPEQRARAFAAELLLPRASAAVFIRGHSDDPDRLDALRQTYAVSRAIAGWQVRNGPAQGWLTPAEHALVRQWTQDRTVSLD